jgi:hypothetical protein
MPHLHHKPVMLTVPAMLVGLLCQSSQGLEQLGLEPTADWLTAIWALPQIREALLPQITIGSKGETPQSPLDMVDISSNKHQTPEGRYLLHPISVSSSATPSPVPGTRHMLANASPMQSPPTKPLGPDGPGLWSLSK